VIQDSTSPIPKKRTRAAVAAAAAAAADATAKWSNGVTNGSAVGKRRKVEEDDPITKKKKLVDSHRMVPALPPARPLAPVQPTAQPAAAAASTTQPPSWDDAEGHYIVKPDDIIGGRCKSCLLFRCALLTTR
jgi:dual-specificity kinase